MMKNLFSRLVVVALLSAAAGMALAGVNPSFKNPAGSNQVSVKTGTTISQVVDAGGNAKNTEGNRIGRNTGGETLSFDDQGNVKFTQDANGTMRSPDGTAQSMDDKKTTRVQDGVQCVEKNFKDGKFDVCHSQSLSKPFKTIDEAVLDAAQSVQNKQCQIQRNPVGDGDAGVGVELHVNGYEKNNEFFYGDTYWFADIAKSAESAPSMKSLGATTGLNHVFCYHNHPNTISEWRSDFFSVADWNSAQSNNIPSYMMTCFLEGGGTTPRMLRLDPQTGDVHERHVSISKEGKLAYEGDWSKTPIYNFNGVLGWCACNHNTCGNLEMMGSYLASIEDMEECCGIIEKICGGDWYVRERFRELHEQVSWCGGEGAIYYLCKTCGKAYKDFCIKPGDISKLAEEVANLVKSGNIAESQIVKMQSADFSRIKDGEIVVKGVCKCSSPCVVRANFWTYVCSACGRLILEPKKTN